MQFLDQFEAYRSMGVGEVFLLRSVYSDDAEFRRFIKFFVCICMSVVIGIYRNRSLSKADCFSRLKATMKSIVSRTLGDFCSTSKRFLKIN